jgi:hypothetical protein
MLKDREEYNLRERELEVEDARRQAVFTVVKEHKEFQDYRRKLEEQALNGYIFCSLEDPECNRAHSAITCQKALGSAGTVREACQLAGSIERFLRRRGVTEEFGCCLSCFAPQEMYDTWEENGTEGGGREIQPASASTRA